MKVVVTGAAGRLGRVLIPRLAATPGIDEIIGIDRFDRAAPPAGYRHLRADVRTSDLSETMAGADVLVHLAFVLMGGGLGRGRHDRERVRQSNVEGSRRSFEAAAASGVGHVIFVSSVAAYGAWPDNPPLIDESAPLRPNPGFAYAEDKAAVEGWLDGFEARHPGTTVTRLRPHAIVGPQAHPFLRLMLNQPFYPAGAGHALTQCVWETDVADAITLAVQRRVSGAFNLAAQPAMSFHDMLRHRRRLTVALPLGLAAAMHRLAWWLTPAVGEPGWVSAMRHGLAVDTARAREALGWTPGYDTPACLARLGADRP